MAKKCKHEKVVDIRIYDWSDRRERHDRVILRWCCDTCGKAFRSTGDYPHELAKRIVAALSGRVVGPEEIVDAVAQAQVQP